MISHCINIPASITADNGNLGGFVSWLLLSILLTYMYNSFVPFVLFLFWGRVLLGSPGWLRTHNPPASSFPDTRSACIHQIAPWTAFCVVLVSSHSWHRLYPPHPIIVCACYTSVLPQAYVSSPEKCFCCLVAKGLVDRISWTGGQGFIERLFSKAEKERPLKNTRNDQGNWRRGLKKLSKWGQQSETAGACHLYPVERLCCLSVETLTTRIKTGFWC